MFLLHANGETFTEICFLNSRELTNRRLSHDVGLRDVPTAHAFVGSCRRRAKVDDVVLSKFTASPKQKNVR